MASNPVVFYLRRVPTLLGYRKGKKSQWLPFAGRPPLQNGHRTGNTITFSFHRGNRDYHVTGTFSSDGATLSGQYKVVQDQKVIYTGKYFDFKRQ